METTLVEDYFLLHLPPTFPVLDDGFVRLVDMMPRMVPTGRTPDFAIIRNARVSLGLGLGDEERDKKLLRYLYINRHTTPFESVIFTFHIRMPRFVATHFHRHRTSSINEFSQRYAEVDENSFFHPSKVPQSLRYQSQLNRQGSECRETKESPLELIKVMEAKVTSLFSDYKQLLELGVAKEVARSFLPLSTYTEMYFTMNLHNLLHLLTLRYDQHSQKETRDYAEAIYKILHCMVPETMTLYDTITREGMYLSGDEVKAIHDRIPLKGGAKEEDSFRHKKVRLLPK